VVEQTVQHLRKGLGEGRWRGRLPGVVRLAAECAVSKGVVRSALQQLEAEGILQDRGRGRSRVVAETLQVKVPRRVLRVGIFLHERMTDENPGMQSTLLRIKHHLEEAGAACFLSGKCQAGLRHQMGRMTGYLAATPADAWVLVAPRVELLEWFHLQATPCIFLGSRTGHFQLAGAGLDLKSSMQAATRKLLELGHQRIVLVDPAGLRLPRLSESVLAFTSELEAHGIRWTQSYNVPDWEETPQGYRNLLLGLFSATPPTALLVDETPRVLATYAFLAERGWRVPDQVSLIATQWDSSLTWCHPPIAHLRWDDEAIVRRVVRWVADLARGKADRRLVPFPAEWVPGGSAGPVWRG
jgi:DNA-binding LacI/PurR family transcriptional regulator